MAYQTLKRDVIKKYTTLIEPGSFTSASKIKRHHYKKTNIKKIEQALENIDAYTKHKPYRRRFPRRKTQTWGIDEQWQVDLVDMQHYSKTNNGYKYILVAVDVFSRYGFAQPILSKKNVDVLAGFEKMTKERRPRSLQSDKGKEFLGRTFQDYLAENNIKFFTGENDDVKCALAERLNSTLQSKLFRYFTYKNTYRWIDVLQPMLVSYNNTHHKTLGGTPAEVTPENSDVLFYRLYEQPPKKPLKPLLLKKGDKVRMLKKKKTFNRGYEPNWTDEVFTIDTVKPHGYKLKDALKEEIKGLFYPPEVQKTVVTPTTRYIVEKVLKYRYKGNKRQGLVKWKGHQNKFNTWEPVKNIK